MSLKRGKYSKEEDRFVVENVHKLSSKDIAETLGRNIESVENLIRKRKLKIIATTEDKKEVERLLGILYTSPHWEKILIALTESEVELFRKDWVCIVQQFGEDIWYTEEKYIVDWLLLDIKKYRTYRLEKEAMQQIERLEKELEIEYNLDIELRDTDKIIRAEQELAVQKSAMSSHNAALVKILEKIEKISEKLKANREERRDVKVNTDTFWGYIQMLEDEKFRKQESRNAQLLHLAQNNARKKLSEYHTYADGEVDIPLLTPEIIIERSKDE